MLDEFALTYAKAGDLGRALTAAEESLGILRRLAADAPQDTRRQRNLSLALVRVADLRDATGDSQRTLPVVEESVQQA